MVIKSKKRKMQMQIQIKKMKKNYYMTWNTASWSQSQFSSMCLIPFSFRNEFVIIPLNFAIRDVTIFKPSAAVIVG